MGKQPIITLKWEKPRPIDEVIDDPEAIAPGVYYITRQYGDKVSMYYIGKTSGSGVKARLKEHAKTTATNCKGKKMVSFARISRDAALMVGNDHKTVIDDVESVLIYSSQAEYNIQKKSSFKTKYQFILKNTGSKGSLKASLNTMDLLVESNTNPRKGKTIDRHRNEGGNWGW